MRLTYEPSALKDLAVLPKVDRTRLMEALQQVADLHPQRQTFTTEMVGMVGYWRARKGIWRAVYRQTEDEITVIAVNKRGEIYR